MPLLSCQLVGTHHGSTVPVCPANNNCALNVRLSSFDSSANLWVAIYTNVGGDEHQCSARLYQPIQLIFEGLRTTQQSERNG